MRLINKKLHKNWQQQIRSFPTIMNTFCWPNLNVVQVGLFKNIPPFWKWKAIFMFDIRVTELM